MGTKQAALASVATVLVAFSSNALSQTAGGIALAIDKHAQLASDGAIVIRIRITCGPFEGAEEFQQSFAGGSQEKSGASSESGIDGMVICDGVTRTHTARLTPFDTAFRRGPARANAGLLLCTFDGQEQECFSGATARAVIVRGPTIP